MKTVDRDGLKAKMDRGDDFVLLEALGEASYNQEHLPGAVRYEGGDQVEALAPDKGTEIVAYCSNFNWHASTRVVRGLTAMGYENAYDYEGGKQDWIEAGLPTEGGGG